MARTRGGTLICIGGGEDRNNGKTVLREVAERVGRSKIVIVSVGRDSRTRDALEEYEQAFRQLGVRHVYKLGIESREEAKARRTVTALEGADGVFFTGGDQLETMSTIGDTPIFERTSQIYEAGGVIAGTSSGAAIMSGTMVIDGNGDESHKVRGSLRMAPGFGLLEDVIVDQHFAERGRLGRLLGAVAQNPAVLGVGIDENTAIVVENFQQYFTVVGKGAVYFVDGKDISYSNLAAERQDRTLSVYDVRLHVLSDGHRFDLTERRPRSENGSSSK